MGSEDIILWADGSWVYASDYCEETEKWRGDDLVRISADDYGFTEDGDLYLKEYE